MNYSQDIEFNSKKNLKKPPFAKKGNLRQNSLIWKLRNLQEFIQLISCIVNSHGVRNASI